MCVRVSHTILFTHCSSGSSPLSAAAHLGHVDVVKVLLEHGAGLAGCEHTVLNLAKEEEKREIVKLLEAAAAATRGKYFYI